MNFPSRHLRGARVPGRLTPAVRALWSPTAWRARGGGRAVVSPPAGGRWPARGRSPARWPTSPARPRKVGARAAGCWSERPLRPRCACASSGPRGRAGHLRLHLGLRLGLGLGLGLGLVRRLRLRLVRVGARALGLGLVRPRCLRRRVSGWRSRLQPGQRACSEPSRTRTRSRRTARSPDRARWRRWSLPWRGATPRRRRTPPLSRPVSQVTAVGRATARAAAARAAARARRRGGARPTRARCGGLRPPRRRRPPRQAVHSPG